MSEPTNTSEFFGKMSESIVNSIITALILAAGLGIGRHIYHRLYQWQVLRKIENTFKSGEPALYLTSVTKKKRHIFSQINQSDPEDHWILRDEQSHINSIVSGKVTGYYHLIIGERGTGKTSLLLDAMWKVNGEGCSTVVAHADVEIFRMRLGKALNFQFQEDYIGNYFSEQGQRSSTALLDIERAFEALEKVGLRRRKRGLGPLILIICSVHLLRDDQDGRSLLQLLQQRAEAWAASSLLTMIFTSDEHRILKRLRCMASRMEMTAITDLPKSKAISALKLYRLKYFQQQPSDLVLEEVYCRIGGRPIYLDRTARAPDMLQECNAMIEAERRWFLNQAWILGSEMNEDALEQQKYALTAMILAQALVKAEDQLLSTTSASNPNGLPEIPLHIACQIMRRSDYIEKFDCKNLFAITPTAMVRADSVLMQQVFRQICKEPSFEEHLGKTFQRISEITLRRGQ